MMNTKSIADRAINHGPKTAAVHHSSFIAHRSLPAVHHSSLITHRFALPLIAATFLSFLTVCSAQEPAKKSDQSPPAKRKPIDWSLLEHSQNNGYATTKIFGIEARGTKFVYVFDRSASMSDHGGKPLRAAKAELLASLNNLDEHNQFYIIFYNEEPRMFKPARRKGSSPLPRPRTNRRPPIL